MENESKRPRNWFSQGGEAYARFRPTYPPELARFLAGLAPGRALAVDVGCGSGQLTGLLGEHFGMVLGLDPSAAQLASAVPHPQVGYVCAAAECLPVADGGADLITVAQAAHWFDLSRFYAEVRRAAAPGAVLALLSYGAPRLDETLSARFGRFYADEIGPFWPAERKLVDGGYADLPFPFDEHAVPPMEIHAAWKLEELLGYISTWSAVRKAREAGREHLLTAFSVDLAALWGSPGLRRHVRWPIRMRLGRL